MNTCAEMSKCLISNFGISQYIFYETVICVNKCSHFWYRIDSFIWEAKLFQTCVNSSNSLLHNSCYAPTCFLYNMHVFQAALYFYILLASGLVQQSGPRPVSYKWHQCSVLLKKAWNEVWDQGDNWPVLLLLCVLGSLTVKTCLFHKLCWKSVMIQPHVRIV